MAGLLDFFNPPQGGLLGEDDRKRAQQSALMGLAQGLLGAGQPSRMPVGFGSAVGQGLGGYAQAQGDAMDSAVKAKVMGQQFERGNMELQRAKDQQAALKELNNIWGTGGGYPQSNGEIVQPAGMNSGAVGGGKFDIAALSTNPNFMRAYAGAYGPQAAIELATKKPAYITAKPGEVILGSDMKPVYQVPEKQERTELEKTLIAAGVKEGSAEWNKALLDYAQKKGAPPQTNVSVTPTVKMGNSIANEVGPLVVNSQSAASGAVDTFDTVGRIRAAMGGANIGPGANIKTIADRIATTFGGGDATAEQRLANTREVVKGLAELTLNGRKALKGQGSVSDFEGKLLERASSGDIDNMTVPELNALLNVSERIARRNYDNHQKILGTMRGNPDLKDIAPFYEVPPLPGAATKPAPAPASLMKGQTVNGYKFKGGNPSDPNSWEPAN